MLAHGVLQVYIHICIRSAEFGGEWCGSVGCGRKDTVLHHDSDRFVRTGLTYSGGRDDTTYM